MNTIDTGIGAAALLLPLLIVLPYLLAVVVVVWAAITLRRMYTTQIEMQATLKAIEQLLQRR